MEKEKVQELADEVYNWLQMAVMDFADGEDDPEDLFEDPQCMSDLSGDRIHDHCAGDLPTMIQLAEELKTYGHDPLTKACDWHIKRWTKRMNTVYKNFFQKRDSLEAANQFIREQGAEARKAGKKARFILSEETRYRPLKTVSGAIDHLYKLNRVCMWDYSVTVIAD